MIPVVYDIGAVVQNMKDIQDGPPFYMYGHRLEINQRLTKMNADKNRKNKKYPLVALRLDFPEDFANEGEVTLNIIILAFSSVGRNAPKRYVEVFSPVLYPLYERFLQELKNSGLFYWSGKQTRPPHMKIDRPYWGTELSENNDAYIFDDPLDGIELIDLKLKPTGKHCAQVFGPEFETTFG